LYLGNVLLYFDKRMVVSSLIPKFIILNKGKRFS